MGWFKRKKKKIIEGPKMLEVGYRHEPIDSDEMFNKLIREKSEIDLNTDIELTTAGPILTLSEMNQVNKYLANGYSYRYKPAIVKKLIAEDRLEEYK